MRPLHEILAVEGGHNGHDRDELIGSENSDVTYPQIIEVDAFGCRLELSGISMRILKALFRSKVAENTTHRDLPKDGRLAHRQKSRLGRLRNRVSYASSLRK